MNCPQCKSDKVEFGTGRSGKIEAGGKVLFGKHCKACGYFWSDDVAPPKLVAPAVAPELKGVPPAPPAAAPAAPAKANGKAKGSRKGQQQP